MVRHADASTGQLTGTNPGASTPDEKQTMHVKVYSPYQTYFDQNAYSISALNNTGPFDILPRHHNFMTLLNPCEISIVSDGGVQRIRIDRGIMHVKADRVVVFLDV